MKIIYKYENNIKILLLENNKYKNENNIKILLLEINSIIRN